MPPSRVRGVTVGAQAAIVSPATRKALTMPRRDLRAMTPAELCCLREDELGMSVRAFAAALGKDTSTVWRWETGPRPPSRRNAARIEALLDYTDAVVDRLAEQAPIVTYATVEAFRSAEDTGGWVLPVEWHRMAAWRAAERSGARIVYSDRSGTSADPRP